MKVFKYFIWPIIFQSGLTHTQLMRHEFKSIAEPAGCGWGVKRVVPLCRRVLKPQALFNPPPADVFVSEKNHIRKVYSGLATNT